MQHSYLDSVMFLGVLIGPNIRTLMKDASFDAKLQKDPEKLKAWKCTKAVILNFLGNNKAPNYEEIVHEMIESFVPAKVKMSLKIHTLKDHLDVFPENLGAVSDEHGEKFHQEIKTMEQRYAGKSTINMLAEYCWSIKKVETGELYTRQSKYKKY